MGKASRPAAAFACAILLAAAAPAQVPAVAAPQAAAVPVLTTAQWREDLRFMAAEMERRHKNLFHTVSRAQFEAAIADLDARIPSLQRNEIVVGMMRIAAMVGDGHSRVDPRKDAKFGFPSLPLKLYLFEDGVYVRAAAPEHAALVGARVEAIGGVPVEEAIRRVSEISSRDNEIGPRLFVPIYLAMPDILHALKLSTGRDAASLKLRKGSRVWTAAIKAGAVDPVWPPDTDISLVTPPGWADARRTTALPMWLQAPLDYHRMIDLPEQRALYVQLNMVTDIKGQTMAEFARKIGARVQASNPRPLILDLRLNHGGNGNLRTQLVRTLIKAEDEDTRLFVLTWRGTFSASQFILDDLDRLTDAVFVGEPASSKPSSFGDAYRMPMPNTGIQVRSSIVWWQAGQNHDPWTWVDVAAPLRFEDYAAGRDPALEAALGYQPGPGLSKQLAEGARSGGVAGARRAAEAYRSNPLNKYADVGQQLVAAAEQLHAAGYPAEALAVAEGAMRDYPRNVDAPLVVAHLAEAGGRIQLAREAGRRTLQLDPNSRVARSLLERLPPEGK
jgi:hypothetical protein